MKTTQQIGLSVLLLALVLYSSCNSGGGGGGGDGAASQEVGTVAILLSDGPAEAHDEINITVFEVSLIPSCDDDDDFDDDDDAEIQPVFMSRGRGNSQDDDDDDGGNDDDDDGGDHDDDDDDGGDGCGDPVTIFESGRGVTINILDFQDEDFLLTVNRSVPAGTYSKIRLRVRDIEAVGGPCEELEVKLPSGKIDLNPRGTFDVVGGSTVTIRLDMDANKSVKLKQAGRSGKCIFRPVVFVDILTDTPPDRCPRPVAGVIAELIVRDDETVGFFLDLASSEQGDVEVRLSDDTVIFDENGLPGDVDLLEEGKTARVRGRLDDEGCLVASVVILGEVLDVDGTVETVVAGGSFEFDPDTGEAIIGGITVTLNDSTFILIGCDTPVDEDAIVPGMSATVVGKFDAETNELRAVAIFLSSAEICGELVNIEETDDGYILSIDPEDDGAMIDPRLDDSGDGTRRIFLPEDSEVRLVGDGTLPIELLAAAVECEERDVCVVLEEDGQDVAAVRLLVPPEELSGSVEAVDDDANRLTVGGRVVQVAADATILDLDGNELIELDAILVGDEVTLFGLAACEGDDVAFNASVVLVTVPEVQPAAR